MSAEPFAPLRAAADLRAQVRAWRASGLTVGLVPTMGALHRGHLALVKAALASCDRVIVTLFVNPTQFGPNEDFTAYPRDEARDLALVAAHGAHALFAPSVEEMYPAGSVTKVEVPGLDAVLEGAFRPGHFSGVATVVAKLLNQAQADAAFFGEKDYQQLQVIRRMASDLCIPTEIQGVPTVREDDGLALSSRNVYLSAEERALAPMLNATLRRVARAFRDGGDGVALCRAAEAELARAGFTPVDYVAIADARTLAPLKAYDPTVPGRVLAAARLGRARLIDNIAVDQD